jgi:hypothetical protein
MTDRLPPAPATGGDIGPVLLTGEYGFF